MLWEVAEPLSPCGEKLSTWGVFRPWLLLFCPLLPSCGEMLSTSRHILPRRSDSPQTKSNEHKNYGLNAWKPRSKMNLSFLQADYLRYSIIEMENVLTQDPLTYKYMCSNYLTYINIFQTQLLIQNAARIYFKKKKYIYIFWIPRANIIQNIFA